jgi:hypothetical protein
MRCADVALARERGNAHLRHQRGNMLAANLEALEPQHIPQHATAGEG